MKTIEAEVEVTETGEIRIPLPPGIEPGRHAVVLVVDDGKSAVLPDRLLQDFPVDSVGPWPSDLSLRREDMYGDRGR
jgi:hypothetical protein